MFETEDGEMGNRVVRVEAKHHSGGPAGRTHLWNDLPRLWELFSFILPPGPRREAFEPAFNDLTEKYALARKFRGKWARRWIGFSFSFLSIVMLLDCVRIMLQSGAGKILLKFLPDPLRTWWRRQ
jgi:hypothetical protein